MKLARFALFAFSGVVTLTLSGCFIGDDYGDASSSQIEDAFAACGVEFREVVRDRALNGDRLVIFHAAEPNHERKIDCFNKRLLVSDVTVTSIFPEPVSREGLY